MRAAIIPATPPIASHVTTPAATPPIVRKRLPDLVPASLVNAPRVVDITPTPRSTSPTGAPTRARRPDTRSHRTHTWHRSAYATGREPGRHRRLDRVRCRQPATRPAARPSPPPRPPA